MTDTRRESSDRKNTPRRVEARIPPHNLNAEESLLGALLLSSDTVNSVAEWGVQVEHFYKPSHQHIYSAIRGLMASGLPVDIVTVADELRRNGLLDEVEAQLRSLKAVSLGSPLRFTLLPTWAALAPRARAFLADDPDMIEAVEVHRWGLAGRAVRLR